MGRHDTLGKRLTHFVLNVINIYSIGFVNLTRSINKHYSAHLHLSRVMRKWVVCHLQSRSMAKSYPVRKSQAMFREIIFGYRSYWPVCANEQAGIENKTHFRMTKFILQAHWTKPRYLSIDYNNVTVPCIILSTMKNTTLTITTYLT